MSQTGKNIEEVKQELYQAFSKLDLGKSKTTPENIAKECTLNESDTNLNSGRVIEELQRKLISLNLDPKGTKKTLKERIRRYYAAKAKKESETKTFNAKYSSFSLKNIRYLLILDIEATCEERNNKGKGFVHEVIEFPVVVIDVESKKVIKEFHSYVKPLRKPILSPFCTKLTGIQQNQIDDSPSFIDTLAVFESWSGDFLSQNPKNFLFVTDGPCDIRKFVSVQCRLSKIKVPRYFAEWLDVRSLFSATIPKTTRQICLSTMLSTLGMKFEGRPHSGIDDARNIARIMCALLEFQCELKPIYTLKRGIHEIRLREQIEAEVAEMSQRKGGSTHISEASIFQKGSFN